jgi:hypothetical protein
VAAVFQLNGIQLRLATPAGSRCKKNDDSDRKWTCNFISDNVVASLHEKALALTPHPEIQGKSEIRKMQKRNFLNPTRKYHRKSQDDEGGIGVNC